MIGIRGFDFFAGALAAAVVLVAFIRVWAGRRTPVSTTHLRGRTLHDFREIVPRLSARRAASDPGLQLGRLRVPDRIAQGHFAFVGATGSGKTLLQRLLMQSVLPRIGRQKGFQAVVYDAKQDALSLLAGMEVPAPIRVLNPLDTRSVAWDMARDATSPATALQVATLLIPQVKSDSNPFFANASRHLLTGVLTSFLLLAPRRWTFRQVLLVLRDPPLLKAVLGQVEATRHLLQYFEHPGTFHNIASTILTHLAPFEIIAAAWDRSHAGTLSLRQWMREESILVLGNDEENRTAIDTINRLIFQRLSELLLAQPEADQGDPRHTWFFLDEIREAGRLDGLSRLLTKGRSKQVAVVLGFQDVNGLREVYGRGVADELLGQCNTKVILRLNSPETAEWASKLHGRREVIETARSQNRSRNFRSLGMDHGGSSGVSLSNGVALRDVVLDSEFLDLPETTPTNGLSAYFLSPMTGAFRDRIPGDWIRDHLRPSHHGTPNALPRPEREQFLRPWDDQDSAVFGLPTHIHALSTWPC